MDATTSRLVEFVSLNEFESLSAASIHECKRKLIDTFACVAGAYHEPLSCSARALAKRTIAAPNAPAASLWGSTDEIIPEMAAFANGIMLRLLDLNDMYRTKSGGHPSDVIAGLFAVGEALRVDGASLINAICISYDIYCGFCDAIDINAQGWDVPVYSALATALGAGKLLKLTPQQLADAASLSLVPNMGLYQTRSGDLSNWKGCSAANASRNGVFAAYLAQQGFTGPTAAFEGQNGLWDIVGKFDWALPQGTNESHGIGKPHMKFFPTAYHGQAPVFAALELRNRLQVQDIAEIQIETYQVGIDFMAATPSRWAPTTHETADHSMPYVTAAALLDGELTSASFSDARLSSPDILALMSKIKVVENPGFTARFPESGPCRLTITLTSGETLSINMDNPKGHANNPMTDHELETKFRGLFRDFGDEAQCSEALANLWNFDKVKDIKSILTSMTLRP